MTLKKIGIVGSRDFTNNEKFELNMNLILTDKGIPINKECLKIISGGARGADTLARMFAQKHGLEITEYKNDFAKYGVKGYFERNKQIVENSDFLIVFWDGESRGTLNTLDHCKKLGKEAIVIYYLNE